MNITTLLADLKCTIAASTNGEWQKGATTHHTVTETGYKIAEFHHASDAQFCDTAHKLMPEIIDTIEIQAKRIMELEAKAYAAIENNKKLQALIDGLLTLLDRRNIKERLADLKQARTRSTGPTAYITREQP